MADNGGGFFKGFLFGGIIGAAVGILLAPKSGRETREELGGEAEKDYALALKDLEHAKKAAMKSFEEGRDKVIEKLADDIPEETPQVEEVKPVKRSRPRTKKSE
ncbi:MAG: YtxH domain-containing protein [Calditrichales bacterium]|nr:MAG: YtxH domain-containing protein [Calditrichales bacterium]